MPEVMIPTVAAGSPSGHSIRFAGWCSAASARASIRAATACRRARAWPGIITYLRGSGTKPRSGDASTVTDGPSDRGVTRLLECDSRVVSRRNTGVSWASDNSKASLVNANASAESAGSSMGTFAAIA